MHEMRVNGPDVFVLGEIIVRSVPSPHSFPSLSYRLEAEDVSLTISGDTDVSEDLVGLARHTDLLVCECSMPDGQKVPGNLVPREAGQIAQRANARKLLLTHFYPPCDEVNVGTQASAAFQGEIVVARDLMVITV